MRCLDAVLAYCGWQNVGMAGARGNPFIPPDYETPDKMAALLEGCRWPIHACLADARAIHEAGGFDPRLVVAEDYLLWLEVATRGPIVRVAEVLAQYQHHGGVQATKHHARAVLDTLRAKQIFLTHHPEVAAAVGGSIYVASFLALPINALKNERDRWKRKLKLMPGTA